ncbi:HGxxPAAW family protein [Streptomyces sp. TG1A-8]|uniref:HGxxPAAW family protein n=1 Tax=Streptomyces sp. TG1A-8 TaxID=3051385 RepID=UPI00265C765A|nr:HGxxPAAW family protein [Streptomyces sp. TG1A-8]MDO0926958.1 HGxxPAAW family protein [Streptomyces sp. TG1A-8]
MSLYDEGHTLAGWIGVGIATAGCTVTGVGVCTVSAPAVVGGLVIVALSAVVTWVLHLSGWGKPPGVRPREQWGMRVRDTRAREGHPECLGCRLAGRRGVPTAAAEASVVPGTVRAGARPLSPVE